jgi:hypothetical protein
MKKTTCNNLGGACDEVLTGETANEMGENSKNHVIQKVQAGDEAHIKAMGEMMALSPEDQQKWYKDFEDNFSSLEDA